MQASAHARSQEFPAPDAELVRAARAGQVQAFGELVERHQALARAVAFSTCGEFAFSEDIAQEALVTAWLRLGDLDDPALFRFWLATIVRNTARYVRRHQRRHAPSATAGVDALANLAADQPTPLQHAQARVPLEIRRRGCGACSSAQNAAAWQLLVACGILLLIARRPRAHALRD
jgi:DNA-directed RNA polymerase specialized sigma24 family protein